MIKNATASYGVDSSKVDSYTPPTKTGVVNYVANVIGSVAGKVKEIVGGGANGTAHVNGTAFAQGNWGTKENGTALMGELGQEVIVRDGHFFTVGDNGAEFVKYKKGDIVFNHKQSEELFKNGYVTSGGGRGKALVSGTAFGRGSGGIGRANKGSSVKTRSSSSSSSKSSSSSSSNSNSNSSANEEADKFEETLDWIETALDRVKEQFQDLIRLLQVHTRTGLSAAPLSMTRLVRLEERLTYRIRLIIAIFNKRTLLVLTLAMPQRCETAR